MSRQSLAHGVRTGAPLAFGAIVFLTSVALAALAAAALLVLALAVAV